MADHQQDHQSDHRDSEIANLSKLPIELGQVITQYINSRRWLIVNGIELNGILREHGHPPILYGNMGLKAMLVWFIDEKPSYLSFAYASDQKDRRSLAQWCTIKTLLELLLYNQIVEDGSILCNNVINYLEGFIQYYQYLPAEIIGPLDSFSRSRYNNNCVSLYLGDADDQYSNTLTLNFSNLTKQILYLNVGSFAMMIPDFLMSGIIEILGQLST